MADKDLPPMGSAAHVMPDHDRTFDKESSMLRLVSLRLCVVIFAGCAAGDVAAGKSGRFACDRNGDQEQRRAC